MALTRRKAAAPEISAPPGGKSLTASAAQVDLIDPSWNFYRFRDETWQRELWRLYDLIGEFRFYANGVGANVSLADIYVAKVDRLGRIGPRVEDENRVSALGDTLFGGPDQKAESLRLMGIDLAVAGECYVLGQQIKDHDADEWYVLSPSELRRYDNGIWWGDRQDLKPIVPGRDLLSRVWTPHPRRIWQADCSARAVMPVLRELEQLTKFVFAQIDSRLFGAGLLPIPNGLDFPQGQDGVESAADSIMMQLAEAGQASMKGEGSATGVLPVIVEMPIEALDKIKLVSFASELSRQALELRTEAVKRLGTGLDVAPEIMQGMGQSSTHWSSWHISSSDVKIHIEPLLTRICGALTKTYLHPALKLMGKDPNRYCYWYDTAPLVVRPQRLEDALNLYKEGLLGAAGVRAAGSFPEHEAPTETETNERFLRELMLRDPTLFATPAVRELIHITVDIAPPELMTPPPPPPAPETSFQPDTAPPLPAAEEMVKPAPVPAAVTAAGVLPGVALVVAADACVRRALERAGGRLLTRENRGRYTDLPHHELHTRLQVADNEHAAKLLTGAWEHLPALVEHLDAGVDAVELERALAGYCTILLTRSRAHEPDLMIEMLRRARMLEGTP